MIKWIIMGGWALWVIVGCSIIALGITFERWRTLRRADRNCESLLAQLFALIGQGKVRESIDLCAATPGPIAETVGIGLRKLVFLERIGKRPEEIEEGIVAAMEDHGGYVVDYLERNLTTLATIASLAPILGMMGTVVGMIHAFLAASASSMTPQVVAKGIGEALLCTAGGLIVAALATVEYNYFTTRVNRFVLRVQAAATLLVEQILEAQANSSLNLAPARPTEKLTVQPATA